MVPRTILTRSGLISLNTARPVNTVRPRTAVNNAGTMKNVINNAYPTARRPFNKIIAANNSNFTKKVNTIKGTRVNTARPKAVLSAVKGNKGNVVKASACWVWRPKHKVLDHVSKNNGASISFKIFDYIDAQGRSKSIMKERLLGKKDKLRTSKLDFEDVVFCKGTKFNLFSFLFYKMCDKKNSVLFTDTECVVLFPDFKLTDESYVLLKVLRKDNMYSIDLKNVIPQGGLTCLFAKATPDESNLWHRRLGHVNFKTMNKLVRGSLVRGLPLSTGRSFVSTDRSNTPNVSAASTSTGANTDESSFIYLGGKISIDASTLPNADLPIDPNMPDLEDASNTLPKDGIFNGAYDDGEDVGVVANFNNMDNTIAVSPIPTLRIHKDHPKRQILGDPSSAVQTRGKIQKASSAQQAIVIYIHKQNRTNHKDHQNCLFACFLSQEEPKTISPALKDKSWVESMQEELLQFKLQQV
ncbi:putative ribonuclease H-like domain-containing protein [Tanacetum coccineum]|uniref:Ribonuclease H-like domain-containing protein n=1 Tax=Tanacetum coccineum TaxID=301880 RepID=A0ABQ5ETX0_9ASTR